MANECARAFFLTNSIEEPEVFRTCVIGLKRSPLDVKAFYGFVQCIVNFICIFFQYFAAFIWKKQSRYKLLYGNILFYFQEHILFRL
jgi:hypothetical protein